MVVTKLGFKLPETVSPVAWALVLGGVWMIVAERPAERRPPSTQITWTVAIAVGLAQVVAATFPYTSRSRATIFIALLARPRDPKAAPNFPFPFATPTPFPAHG